MPHRPQHTATVTYGEKTATTSYEVTVGPAELSSVEQKSLTTVEATFTGDASKLLKSDITITNTNTGKTVTIKDFDVDSENAKTAIITTYEDLTDSVVYDVTCAEVTKSFTATDGVIANIEINPTDVVCKTDTVINAVFEDVNGVELGTIAYGETTFNSHRVDFDVEVTEGYITTSGLYLNEAGNTAVANVKYHSGVYENGEETGNVESGAVTITATAAAEITGWAIKCSKYGDRSYSTVEETEVAAGETSYAYIQATKSGGTTANTLSGYTFESSNADIATVESSTESDMIKIYAYQEGNLNILVKDADNKIVATFPLTVVAERYAATLALDKYSVTVSDADLKEDDSEYDTVTVTATLKDQYGREIEIDGYYNKITINEECSEKDWDSGSYGVAAVDDTECNKINVSVNQGKTAYDADGNVKNKVTVEVGGLTKTLSVTIADAGDTVSYALELDVNNVDSVVNCSDDLGKKIVPTIYGYDENGIKTCVADSKKYTWTAAKGTVTNTEDDTNLTDAEVSNTGGLAAAAKNGKIQVTDTDSNNIVCKMETGTYKLTAENGEGETYSATFTITDSQPEATAKVEKKTLETGDLNDIISVSYNGSTVDDAIVSYNGSSDNDATQITASGSLYISSIKVKIPIDTDCYLEKEISIKQTFTIE